MYPVALSDLLHFAYRNHIIRTIWSNLFDSKCDYRSISHPGLFNYKAQSDREIREFDECCHVQNFFSKLLRYSRLQELAIDFVTLTWIDTVNMPLILHAYSIASNEFRKRWAEWRFDNWFRRHYNFTDDGLHALGTGNVEIKIRSKVPEN